MSPGRALSPEPSIVSMPPLDMLRAIRLILPSSIRMEPLLNPVPFQMSASSTRIFRSSKSTAVSVLFFGGAKFFCAVLTKEDPILLH